jgi:hypothetical protein
MKLREILTESIEFDVSKMETWDDGTEVATAVGERKDVDCDICGGAGTNTYRKGTPDEWTDDCGLCSGTGTQNRFVPTGPSITLSNINAFELLRAVGLDNGEYIGRVLHKDLPALKRRLMMIINSDNNAQSLVKPATDNDTTRTMGRVQKDDGTTGIGRQGARMVGAGRTSQQAKQLAKHLLDIVDYASRDPNHFISWG